MDRNLTDRAQYLLHMHEVKTSQKPWMSKLILFLHAVLRARTAQYSPSQPAKASIYFLQSWENLLEEQTQSDEAELWLS